MLTTTAFVSRSQETLGRFARANPHIRSSQTCTFEAAKRESLKCASDSDRKGTEPNHRTGLYPGFLVGGSEKVDPFK